MKMWLKWIRNAVLQQYTYRMIYVPYDTFVMFSSFDHIKKCHIYLNSRHKNMTFTYKVEHDNCLPFLDVLVTREGDSVLTSVYRKPTFSGLYTNFYSYISEKYKKGLIFSLIFRIFTFTVDWNKFHTEVEYLKEILRKNSYPEYFIDKCIKMLLDKKINPSNVEIRKPHLTPVYGSVLKWVEKEDF